MEKIILIRPWEYFQRDGWLTQEGHGKIFDLSLRFKEFTNNSRLNLITSQEICARENSKILAHFCNISISEFPHAQYILGKFLYSKSDRDNEKICRLVEIMEVNTDVLIMVTHESQISSFPKYYSKTRLNRSCSSIFLEAGEALLLNCKKTETIVYNHQYNCFDQH